MVVAPSGNNLATICYKDFLGLATINMYYYYYYYCMKYVLCRRYGWLYEGSHFFTIKSFVSTKKMSC